MICYQKNAAEYLTALFNLKSKMNIVSYKEQDEIWLKSYKEVTSKGYKSENLPYLLALIHPDFYSKNGKSFVENVMWFKNSKFKSGILKTDKCQSKEYTNIDCIFNSMPNIRGKCEADHRFPNSLGGPSILDNRLLLCRFHNGMKSNDVSHFNWSVVPNWLEEYLERIYRLKL